MEEKKKTRREWVKTAAIIFLSVMLVLTFFSQTIMNYSLPEIAAQYIQPGNIASRIRGTGIIESGDPYEVNVKETRKVKSVAVRVGDVVSEGDILLYLSGGESAELAAAKQALKEAQDAYAMETLKETATAELINEAKKNVSDSKYREQLTKLQDALKQAEAEALNQQTTVNKLQENIDAHATQITYEQGIDQVTADRVNVAQGVADKAADAKAQAETAYATAESNKNNVQSQIDAITPPDPVPDTLLAQLAAAEADLQAKTQAKNTATTNYDNAAKELAALQKALEDRNASQNLNNLTAMKAALEYQKAIDSAKLEKLISTRDGIKADISALLEKIGYVSGIKNALEAVNTAEKNLKEIEKTTQSTTVVAEISGTIMSIDTVAGKEVSAAMPVMTIQPEGQGYTMKFSVTNDQAKKLSVGDYAELINSWRYDDVSIVLRRIAPDRQSPSQKKELTFDVTGDVMAGQSLNVSVGERSANYEMVVPNSAVREDNNGKFILIVESKSSPLGNRYIAKRVDVQVLASDDTKSAISGELYGYEFVITTSTKPVEAGKQVRLADE